MDILEYLETDHDKLRREITVIKQNISYPNILETIRIFICSYEVHEAIEEDILMPALNNLPENKFCHETVFENEHAHTNIWSHLDKLVDAVKTLDLPTTRKLMFDFSAYTESHFGYEERVLFPRIRQALSPEILKSLGEEAKKRFLETTRI